MSRSKHHGCGGTCGLCKPHKKWRGNYKDNQHTSVKRQPDYINDVSEQPDHDGCPVFCKGCYEAMYGDDDVE